MERPERLDRADWLERPGMPLAPASASTQSSGRGLPDNPAASRRMPSSSGSNVPVPPLPAGIVAANGFNLATIPPPPPAPTTNIRASNGSLGAAVPIAPAQVIALAREAMKEALRHTDQQAGDGQDVSTELKLGLTIDLSRKNIQKLPDEVVDIIKDKLERLALSHNKLSGFPARFAECASLRYLNVRSNEIREFPLALCDLRSLEILDLGRNKLRVLPPEIVRLTSLKVFAVQKNRIEELPLCLADMASLQMLKLDGNPIKFPPPEVFQVRASTPANEGHLQESEVTEVTVTSHVKKFLKQAALSGAGKAPHASTASTATDADNANANAHANAPLAITSSNLQTLGPSSSSGSINGSISGSISGPPGFAMSSSFGSVGGSSDTLADESYDPLEPPRVVPTPTPTPMPMPAKRSTSGRFPIKVNGAEVGDLRSPGQVRPPPIPNRSHYRGLSQQNTTRRPGPNVMPLMIGSVSERVRSNSETTLLPTPRGERPMERFSDRSRRMGIVTKKTQELGTLDEMEANNRFSHYRGLSHGSAMTGSPLVVTSLSDTKSPASPVSEMEMSARPVYVRRLSVLPERRRESRATDPVIEAAKGILYSVFQVHPTVQTLMGLAKTDSATRRSSLERVCYNTHTHVAQLEREIEEHELAVESGAAGGADTSSVHRACATLLHAYEHVCSLLRANVDMFLDHGDPRYIRTLLLQLYNSIMELRVTAAGTVTTSGYRKSASGAVADRERDALRDRSAVTSNASELTLTASVGETIKPGPRAAATAATPTTTERGLGVARGGRSSSVTNNHNHNPANLRVATDVPMPPPPHSFIGRPGRTTKLSSATPRSGESFASGGSRAAPADFTEDDRTFERIFLALQQAVDVGLRVLPGLQAQYAASLRAAMGARAGEHVARDWRVLAGRCSAAVQQAEALKSRLSNIQLKEPGGAWQDEYWAAVVRFFDAWYGFADTVRSSTAAAALPADTRARLRPLHQCCKAASRLIQQSPWQYTLRQAHLLASPGSVLPMTPQSAALGPAVQATVPSTPQTGSFASAFAGGVFERADALISSGGISMARANTFSSATSGGSSGLNSLTSLAGHDGGMGMAPMPVLSPSASSTAGPSAFGPLPFRLNPGNKAAF